MSLVRYAYLRRRGLIQQNPITNVTLIPSANKYVENYCAVCKKYRKYSSKIRSFAAHALLLPVIEDRPVA